MFFANLSAIPSAEIEKKLQGVQYQSLEKKVYNFWKFQDFSVTQILREINF